jgi:hypothetical protein
MTVKIPNLRALLHQISHYILDILMGHGKGVTGSKAIRRGDHNGTRRFRNTLAESGVPFWETAYEPASVDVDV